METPLGMQFNEFDTDKDGRLNDSEAYQLLKMLGKNVYQGTVRQVIIPSCRSSNTWTTSIPKTKPFLSTSSRSTSIRSKISSNIKSGSINTKSCTALQNSQKKEIKDKGELLLPEQDPEVKNKTPLKVISPSKSAQKIHLILPQ